MNRGAVAGVAADVRSGSKADIGEGAIDVRFTPRKRTSIEALFSRALAVVVVSERRQSHFCPCLSLSVRRFSCGSKYRSESVGFPSLRMKEAALYEGIRDYH